MENENQVPKKKSHAKIIWLIIILAIAVALGIWWLVNYNKYISTDDANLDSYRVDVSSRVMGPILHLYAWEGDTVKRGMLLLEVDSSNVTTHLWEAKAQRSEIYAQLKLDEQNLKTAQANLRLSEIALELARENYNRAKTQYEGNAISQESYQAEEENYESAKVHVDISLNQIDVSQAQIAASEASLASAEASIESIKTTLSYYKIYAPSDGVIAKRWYLPGDIIQPGQTILTLNQGKDLWVQVYLEETKFKSIEINQPAEFVLDAYKHLTFKGKIYYIGSNAASEFSLIPPSNASGNYTKVTQRIPMKISVEECYDHDKKIEMPPLVSGMSATVKIKKNK